MRNLVFFLALLLMTGSALFAQVGINTDNSAPDNSAMLDVKSTTKGFLPPRVALTAADVAGPVIDPATGLFVYNTATSGTAPDNVAPGYYCWNGTRWVAAILPPGTNAGDMLYWNGIQWISVPVGVNGQVLTLNNGVPAWGGNQLPTVSTTPLTGITTVAATSGGNVTADGGATITARGVCWNTSSGPVVTGSHTTDAGTTGSYSSNLTGLAAGTLYYVRAYATNNLGTTYGNELTFNTLALPIVTTTVVTSITTTTAASGGNVTSDGGSPVTARGVCWSTSPGPTTATSFTTNGGGSGTFVSSLTALSQGTTYYVRAYAANSVGTAYGTEVTFTTLTTPTITTTAVTGITQTTAASGGNVSSEGGIAVTARGVCWSTTSGPVIAGNHTTDGAGAGTFVSNLTGLTKGTLYYVRAYATNSVGTAYGDEVSFTTLPCGDPITVSHLITGGVAPVDKTVTYGTVTNIPGETTKCWITSNLGADHQASAVNDATEPSAGWYWQFNRKKGYKNDGTTVTPSWTITSIDEVFDWITANDPCAIELGAGWHVPTSTEWTNVDGASGGNWTNWNGPWNSGLNLHAAGYLEKINGALTSRGSRGSYWSGTQSSNINSTYLNFLNTISNVLSREKAYGYSVRCLRDN
ncbi:MAG: hypothetical protein NT040_17165 [Bacteroidetes bacterium]|nr:hypothetical protein [Bacteroidota bacterium]